MTTACSGDAAFVRVAPATFALRAFHPDLVEEIPERRGPLPHAVQAAMAAARPTEKMTEEQLHSTSMSEVGVHCAGVSSVQDQARRNCSELLNPIVAFLMMDGSSQHS